MTWSRNLRLKIFGHPKSVSCAMPTVMTEWHFPYFVHSVRAHCGRQPVRWMARWLRAGPEIFVLS